MGLWLPGREVPWWSRRTFLKGLLGAGMGSLVRNSKWAQAAEMVNGRPTNEVYGVGVPPGVVRLNLNENPLGASPRAIEAVARHLDSSNRYDFSSTLLMALLKYHGLPIPRTAETLRKTNRIIIGVGTTEILQLLGLSHALPHGELIEAYPAYGQITHIGEELAKAGYNVTVKRIPLTSGYQHDLEAMRQAITDRTTLVIICNPHNPTGTILSHEEIVRFVDSVPEQVTVVIDEVYVEYIRTPNYQTALHLGLERDNVMVLRTFSKVFGIGGLRVGYGIGSPRLVNKLHPFAMGAMGRNILAMEAARAALEDQDHVKRSQKIAWKGLDYFTGELEKMGLNYIPSQSCSIMIDVQRDSLEVVKELAKRRVFIRPGAGQWGMPSFIRISCGLMSENRACVEQLRQVLGS